MRKVVKGRLSSSSFNPKNAYLRSREVNIAFPCRNCKVAVTSGITFGGDSKSGLIGEKSTISLPKQPGFALGIKYELTPNRWWPVGETGALRISLELFHLFTCYKVKCSLSRVPFPGQKPNLPCPCFPGFNFQST